LLVTLDDKEDHERSILHSIKYGATLRFNDHGAVHDRNCGTLGGMTSARSKQTQEDAVRFLLKKYPYHCAPKFNKPHEILVQQSKNQHLGRKQPHTTHTHKHAHTRTHNTHTTHTHTHTHARTHTQTHSLTHSIARARRQTHTQTHTPTHTHLRAHAHTQAHTHTHTNACPRLRTCLLRPCLSPLCLPSSPYTEHQQQAAEQNRSDDEKGPGTLSSSMFISLLCGCVCVCVYVCVCVCVCVSVCVSVCLSV
jgi:hypothetical protein